MAKEEKPRTLKEKPRTLKEKNLTTNKKSAKRIASPAALESHLASRKTINKQAPQKAVKRKSAGAASATPTVSNLEEAIRLRAYEIYLRRGCQPGNPHEDWAVAEREIRQYIEQLTDAQA